MANKKETKKSIVPKIEEPKHLVAVFGGSNVDAETFAGRLGKEFPVYVMIVPMNDITSFINKNKPDLYIDLSDECTGIKEAMLRNKYAIAISSSKALDIKYMLCKETYATHVTLEENILYHVGRFLSGELQKELACP